MKVEKQLKKTNKVKKLNFLLIIYISVNTCFSQEISNNYFFENINHKDLPIVIDDFNFSEIDTYTAINYEDISHLLKSRDGAFSFQGIDKKKKIYIYGKYIFYDYLAVILFFKNSDTNSPTCFLNLYDKNHNLISFKNIAWKNGSESLSCILYLNRIIQSSMPENKINYLIYDPIINSDELSFPFSNYQCEEIEECLNFKKNDTLSIRNFEKLFFDINFFKNEFNLIPLKFCSPNSNSQILYTIEEDKVKSYISFFIDSKKLENEEKIVFFLNIYDIDNYNIVKEVGYQIFDSSMKLIKREQIALYFETREGITSLTSGNVIIDNNSLNISIMNTGYNPKIIKMKIK